MSEKNHQRRTPGRGNGNDRHGGRNTEQRQGNGGQNPEPPQSMRAPYNFVPLSAKVYFPDWAEQVSQDLPFSDGLCGTIGFQLVAATPLLVAGESAPGEVKTFMRLPDDTVAIPGSALRGMTRAVLEIAGFGKFCRVDDRAMSVRDLTGPMRRVYGDKMTGQDGNTFFPKSRAGWLRFHQGAWELQPCSHLRVDYAQLDELSGLGWNRERKTRGWRKTAPEKYAMWAGTGRGLDVHYIPKDKDTLGKPQVADHEHSERKRLRYIKVGQLMQPGSPPPGSAKRFSGRLVFTGHPTPNKHMDFVFTPPSDNRQLIGPSEDVMQAFLQIHGERPESDWPEFWRPRVNKGEWIPVFYLPDAEGKPTAMGLSQMFKLAYAHGIHDAIGSTSRDHLQDGRRDLVEVMFGDAPAGEAEGSRGRISFAPARLLGAPHFKDIVETVLNGPKPSFFPNYIEQAAQAESAGRLPQGGNYSTLMKDAPRLRGWKRYPARPADQVAPPVRGAGQKDSVISRLQPLAEGARFSAEVRIHNLREVELGALLWAMRWGDRPDCAHGLGLGKPFGFGQVRLENLNLSGLRPNDGQAIEGSAAYIEKFITHMKKAIPNWENSEQLKELLAMAAPANACRADLAHYSAAPKDFASAKKNGLVLKRYSRLIGNN